MRRGCLNRDYTLRILQTISQLKILGSSTSLQVRAFHLKFSLRIALTRGCNPFISLFVPVIARILEMTGPNTKIHVIAHCVGGLSIHIALLGGHISATHIASLSCTNSSMYFKLTTSAIVKMWLPLIPVGPYFLYSS